MRSPKGTKSFKYILVTFGAFKCGEIKNKKHIKCNLRGRHREKPKEEMDYWKRGNEKGTTCRRRQP